MSQKYIAYIGYLFDGKTKCRFIELNANKIKDAMIEAPALVVDKIFWQATTMINRIQFFKLLTQYDAQEKACQATDYDLEYLPNLCKWSQKKKAERIIENVTVEKL